jgi:hypothetical protein
MSSALTVAVGGWALSHTPFPRPSTLCSAKSCGQPIQIIMPTTPSGLSLKDLIVPIATLLGACLGFGGAILAARLAARAQDRRLEQEVLRDREAEDRSRSIRRIEAFVDRASGLMTSVLELSQVSDADWASPSSAAARIKLRITVSETLAAGKILDTALGALIDRFCRSALSVATADKAQSGRVAATNCGRAFEALLDGIGSKVSE